MSGLVSVAEPLWHRPSNFNVKVARASSRRQLQSNPGQHHAVSSRLTESVCALRCYGYGRCSLRKLAGTAPQTGGKLIGPDRPEIDANGPRRAATGCDVTLARRNHTRLDVTPVCACAMRVSAVASLLLLRRHTWRRFTTRRLKHVQMLTTLTASNTAAATVLDASSRGLVGRQTT